MAIIGVAGMPGSGKTTLMGEHEQRGFVRIDDMNRDWNAHCQIVRELLAKGKDVIVSDIMFCQQAWRERLRKELPGHVIQWMSFENAPYKCALNVLHRRFELNHCRNWADEMNWIAKLTEHYVLEGTEREVVLRRHVILDQI